MTRLAPAVAHRPGRAWPIPIIIGVAAGALVAFFDLGTRLPLNDEWQYRWPIERLAAGHGLQLYPGIVPPALVQLLAALPFGLLHLDPRLYRLAVIPFGVLAAAMSWLMARRLGADRFWAGVAGVAVPAAPLTLSVATGFESDVPYLGLLLACAYAGIVWLDTGRARALCVGLAFLAALQRQHAIAIPLAMSLVMAIDPGLRSRLRREWPWLALLWLVVLLALAVPYITGLSSELQRQVVSGQTTSGASKAASVVGAVVWLGPVVGLVMLPFLLVALGRPGAEARARGRLEVVPVGLAVVALVTTGLYSLRYGNAIWPGDVVGNWGLGPLHLGGSKPSLAPLVPFLVLEILTMATVVVLLVRRRRAWLPGSLGNPGLWLVLLALAQLGPMAFSTALDRYYIPVAGLLVPVVAAAVARGEAGHPGARLAGRAWATVILAVGLAWFVAAEQDYQAWQGAREGAAQVAYRLADPHRVEAGFEAVGVHAQEQDFLSKGKTSIDLLTVHANNPLLYLMFAGWNDPRPGRRYESGAPGKIVIVCGKRPTYCPLPAP